MALMITDVLVAFDHQRHEVTLIANAFVEDGGIEEAYARAVETIGEVRERLREPVPAVEPCTAEKAPINFQSNMSREQFEATVSRIIEYVHAGDAFQVVPSQRFTSPCPVEAFSIYRGLRTVNPSPYMYFLDFGDFEIAGASPEPLVKVTGRPRRDQADRRAPTRAAPTRRRTASRPSGCSRIRRSAPST